MIAVGMTTTDTKSLRQNEKEKFSENYLGKSFQISHEMA